MTVIEDGNPLNFDLGSVTPCVSPFPSAEFDLAATSSDVDPPPVLTPPPSPATSPTPTPCASLVAPSVSPETKYLNIHRIQQTSELLEAVHVAQMVKYELKPVPAIRSILLGVESIGIVEQEEASYKNEPSVLGGASVRGRAGGK
jgi:hypothetical protein